MRKSWGLLAVLVALVARPAAGDRPAPVCTCSTSTPSILLPRDGATGVPTNVRVLLTADRVGLDAWAGTDVARTPPLGIVPRPVKKKGARKPVKAVVTSMLSEAWGTIYIVTAQKPLKANTAYDVVVMAGKKPAQWQVISGFTTGAAADTAPPIFAGVERFTAVVSYRAAVSVCDGRPPFQELTWKYGQATDEGTAAGDLLRILYVQRKGEPRQVRLIEPFDAATPITGVSGSTCDPFRPVIQPGDEVCATIEVVDLAGNVAGAAIEKCMTAKKL